MTDWEKFTDHQLIEVHGMCNRDWKLTGDPASASLMGRVERELYRRIDQQE